MSIPILIIACIGGLVTGIGISLHMVSSILDDSNNMGDSTSGFMHYSNGDINYSRHLDDVGSDDRYYFFASFGDPKNREEFMMDARMNAKAKDNDIYMHPGMPMYKPDL